MSLRATLTTTAVTTLLLLGSAREAQALESVDIEVAAKVGVGSNPTSYVNPLGVGLGARAGVSVLGGLYAGANIVDYFGGDNGAYSAHSLQYGLEGGWGFHVLSLTIRPQVGFGNLSVSYALDGNILGVSLGTSSSYLYVEPGITAFVALGSFFVGADVNGLIVPSVTDPIAKTSSTYTALTAHGQLGYKF